MKPWVRYVGGRFMLTWPVAGGYQHRRLTRWEVILWRLLARTPNP